MKSLNQATLIGNLVKDPKITTLPSGVKVANFSIATDRTWKTTAGELKEDVQYHQIVAWDKLAVLVEMFLFKGRKVYVTGRIETKKFTDSAGIERYSTDIVANDFIVFDSRKPEGEEIPKVEQEVVAQPAMTVTTEDINF